MTGIGIALVVTLGLIVCVWLVIDEARRRDDRADARVLDARALLLAATQETQAARDELARTEAEHCATMEAVGKRLHSLEVKERERSRGLGRVG